MSFPGRFSFVSLHCVHDNGMGVTKSRTTMAKAKEKKTHTHKAFNSQIQTIYILIGFSFDCRVLIKYLHLGEHWI